jgi:hypothetical protein
LNRISISMSYYSNTILLIKDLNNAVSGGRNVISSDEGIKIYSSYYYLLIIFRLLLLLRKYEQ